MDEYRDGIEWSDTSYEGRDEAIVMSSHGTVRDSHHRTNRILFEMFSNIDTSHLLSDRSSLSRIDHWINSTLESRTTDESLNGRIYLILNADCIF